MNIRLEEKIAILKGLSRSYARLYKIMKKAKNFQAAEFYREEQYKCYKKAIELEMQLYEIYDYLKVA